ncbi:hypothetical protein B9Z44_00820 [Limnohabitans curvus]|uniref:Filamentous haemagglutinin FhaB/tRNA nuclease CdiA-like TPS domain-containing protein n=1 Tax=Limnohabitans curvus TaxID=323423 RepID=A0A315EQP6_9BURK|nr:filamentous hemagglutinin N-terminal domain-containing protein [Limnohabitans curvus]PUE58272.1 hypothetical protein B9Z44_00820 [Limnohabitans curvus]
MKNNGSLNRNFRHVWSDATQSWHVAPETARGAGKRSGSGHGACAIMGGVLTSVAMAAIATLSHAQQAPPVTQLPTGASVVRGAATIGQTSTANSAVMNINQSTQRAAINWNTFNVGASAIVNFNQPNSSAVTLNRVNDVNASQIFGRINAPGQVFLTNPNGVYFSPSAQVDVGALVATTHSISDDNFMAGNYRFERNGATGKVLNDGQLNAALGGYIALLAPEVQNGGVVVAQAGTVAMAAGEVVTLNFDGNQHLAGITTTAATLETLIENRQAIRAPGGLIILSAKSVADLQAGVVNNTGAVEATQLNMVDGVIRLDASQAVIQTGTLRAPQISVATKNLIDAGTWDASAAGNGSTARGGRIHVVADENIEQTQAAQWHADGDQAGSIWMQAKQSAYVSGSLSASGGRGGDVSITAPSLTLAGASVHADGDLGGGTLRIGGGWQGGDADLPNADKVTVMATQLSANARDNGDAGTVVVWSENQTQFGGHISAQGGAQAGHGGQVEVSSHQNLVQAGTIDVSAPHGNNGQVLFDPKNIEIISSVVNPSVLSLTDTLAANRSLGATLTKELLNSTTSSSLNRILVTSETDSTVATSAGSIKVFNATTGALVSSLTGSSANDKVGVGALTDLGAGKYTFTNSWWGSAGTLTNAKGAVTWFDGTLGVSGVVSSSNSLVGTATGDQVGTTGVTALTNGNYIVRSALWGGGTTTTAKGAITWGSGTFGVMGNVSSTNSLVGGAAGDNVGSDTITSLGNGNYVVKSPMWGSANGTPNAGKGAVTWINGSTGLIGTLGSTNSLVGGALNDRVGANGITVLTNGNYLVLSANWSTAKGAITWGSGTSGVSGVVANTNSLVGGSNYYFVGKSAVVLNNGNAVVLSASWGSGNSSGTNPKGAVTWVNGSTGITGTLNNTNSLVGTLTNDQVGATGITALSNGNYIVRSALWNGGTTSTAYGAVTWGSGVSGVVGGVSAANSLVGSSPGDRVGLFITNLLNGNAVVSTPYWSGARGASTWVDGTRGISGYVSNTNSLVGTNALDYVGTRGADLLSNGNYVVRNDLWNGGLGAMTWGSGTSGVVGDVSSANSLVGVNPNDAVASGSNNIIALGNGKYLLKTLSYGNDGSGNSSFTKGAITWFDGAVGITGFLSSANSLIGDAVGDAIGSVSYITVLANGNYFIRSPLWGSGGVASAAKGAITWGNGATGTTGVVSSLNSLVGAANGDSLGSGATSLTALNNGNVVITSPLWGSGNSTTANAKGAVTWIDGSTGLSGTLSSSNSLVGSAQGDRLGSGGVTALSNGNYIVLSPFFQGGISATTASSKGAITWGSGTLGLTGVVSTSNSLVGAANGDSLGSGGAVTALNNGNVVITSPLWGSGDGTTDNAKGAATWMNGVTGLTGTLSDLNSLVGDAAGDRVGATGVTALTNGNFVVRSAFWGGGVSATAALSKGAITWGSGTSGISGVLSSNNSLVGFAAGDHVGSGAVTALSNGDAVVMSPLWGSGNGTTANAKGAATWITGSTGVTGILDSSGTNSLLGSTAGDQLGSGGAVVLLDGRVVLSSPEWRDPVSGAVLAGRVDILGPVSSSSLTSTVGFSTAASATSKFLASDLVALLDAGTSVTLQASNDITVSAAVNSAPVSSSGGLTLQAGRSVLLNAGIGLGNANLSIIGNEWVTPVNGVGGGVVDAERDAGNAVITQAANTSLNVGTGTLEVILRGSNGGGKTNEGTGAITLRNVTASHISVTNDGTTVGSDIALGTTNAAQDLTLTTQGGAIDVGTSTVGGNLVVNSHNGAITQAGALTVTGTSSLDAGTGDVTLANVGNDFTGAVSATGAAVQLTDANALTLGTVATTGDFLVASNGALDLGLLTVGGALSANSTNGDITQTGVLTVTGTSTLGAGTGRVTLTNAANQFGGAVTTTASSVDVQGNAGLTPTGLVSSTTATGASAQAPAISGTVTPGATVSVYDGTTLLGTATADAVTGAWTYQVGSSLSTGSHSITARQTVGGVTSVSTPLTFVVTGQPSATLPPVIPPVVPVVPPVVAPVLVQPPAPPLEIQVAPEPAPTSETTTESTDQKNKVAAKAVPAIEPALKVASGAPASADSNLSSSFVAINAAKSDATVVVNVLRAPTAQSVGLITVTLPMGLTSSDVETLIPLVDHISSADSTSKNEVLLTLPNGKQLPSWITYNTEKKALVLVAVPDASFPFQMLMNVDGQRSLLQIQKGR